MADTIIPNVVVSMPSQIFTLARSFKAASSGRIYIGKIDTDPTIPENQIQVYLENEDGSLVPIAQPIIINAGGYPVYNGQIAKFVTVQGHSMAVYDAYGTQQFYYPNVLKYDPDQFSQAIQNGDGFKYIGKASSYENLKTFVPTKPGQFILLASYYEGWSVDPMPPTGGEFVSVLGSAQDDGGHICVPNGQTGIYWKRVTNVVSLVDYGVKTFSWNDSNVILENDQSGKINSACARAVYTGMPLVAPPSSFNGSLRGIPVLKSIDITNVKEIRGDLLLFCHNTRGSYTNDLGLTTSTGVNQPFVLFNMNGDFGANGGYIFSTVKGPRKYGTIRVVNLGDRSTRLNGQLHFFASTSFDQCFSEGFNGWGIHWGVSQDSVIGHQSSSRCGSINQFSIFAYSYPRSGANSDFCNNLTFTSTICEYSQDRSVMLAGPNVHYERIHEEGTLVTGNTPASWGVHSIDSYAASYGSKIANFALAINNGVGSQLNIVDLNGLSSASFNAVLNMAYSEFGLVQAIRTATDKTYLTNVIVGTGWSGDGGSVETLRADRVYIDDTASKLGMVGATLLEVRGPNVVVERASTRFLNLYSGTVKNYSGSSTGYVNLGGSTYPARLLSSTITSAPIYVDTTSGADSVIDGCYIATSITRGRFDGSTVTASGSRPVQFRGCEFTSAFDLPSAGALMEFTNCRFSNLVLGTGTYYQIHKGSRIEKLTKNVAAWGLWAFDDSTIVRALEGVWAWPDTAYGNYGLRVVSPMDGKTRKYTTTGWIGDV